MLGDTTVLATSGDNTAATAPERALEGGEVGDGRGGSSNSSEDDKNIMNRVVDEGERMNYGANRWPRQETLALLKIRSDMDTLFRDSTPKGPLWEEVSRKLAELGYHRSAKKCKEKFENVYKYHKRTKDGRTSKPEGKTYRFFDQLQALDHHNHPPPPPPKPPAPTQVAATTTAPLPWSTNNPPPTVSLMPNPINAMPLNIVTPPPATNPTMPTPMSSQPPNLHSQETFPSFPKISAHLFSSSTSSSTASDELEKGSRKRKRKWKEFFHRLTKNVIKKQEELQRKFLETVEKHEHERILREESWRIQEMARINREHEILIQERSSAAAKDAAIIQFLQKISGHQLSLPDKVNAIISPAPTVLPVQTPPPPQPQQPRPPAPLVTATLPAVTNLDFSKRDNGDSNATNTSSSRWPKAEVQALINLRTSLDMQYQENGPKGPLWEDISARMKNLGYNRSAKRCKEKWENINKYFKKVKESSKKRSEDSKTCPYFFQLDALYKEKNKNNNESGEVNLNSAYAANPISTVHAPVIIRPEQQWPAEENRQQTVMEENERINMDQNFEEDVDDDDEDVETEDDDDDGGGFEVVASKPPEVGTNGERSR